MNRRQLLAVALSTPLLPEAAAQDVPFGADRPVLTNAYLADVDAAENEPILSGASRPPNIPPWASQRPRPEASWVSSSEQSIDYRHLDRPDGLEPFELSANRLKELMQANAFPVRSTMERILFGLRGCTLAPAITPPSFFQDSITLQETIPNHVDARCLLGVLQLDPLRLWATPASTVPAVDRMYEYARGGRPSNLLPTGAHTYVVGLHGRSNPRAAQPAAFLQSEPVCVLRTANDLSYAIPKDSWDFLPRIVNDNIHAAVRDAGTAGPPFFSSAGCQTIPGDYDYRTRSRPLGAWAAFREHAGLASTPKFTDAASTATTDDGRRFLYVLLTGRDARLAATEGVERLSRWRFGSVHPAIARVRNVLGLPGHDRFDQALMTRLIQWQLERSGVADGILTATQLNELST